MTATTNLINNFESFGLARPTWDLFIFVFFIGTSLLFIFALTRRRIIIMILANYLILALINLVPFFKDWFYTLEIFFGWKIISFLIFLIVIDQLLARALYFEEKFVMLWQLIWFSILEVGVFLVIILSFFPKDVLNYLHPFTQYLFLSGIAKAFWFTLPIVSLVLAKK